MKLPKGHTLPIIIAWEKLNFFLLVVPLIILSACAPTHTFEANMIIPTQADWVDCGPIFSAGAEEEWDYILWGGFASTVVKRDGIFYLYYQGSDGYDDIEHTVTWRSIGVATSSDGFNFTKYAQNPVLTWFPRNNLEEGAVSGDGAKSPSTFYELYYQGSDGYDDDCSAT
jgi:hypothetical protein